MNDINSFTFYRDYFNLIDTIQKKDKMEVLCAIVDYMFKDMEPNLKGHNLAIFNTLKAQMNLSKSNSKRRTKQEPKENQKETEKEPKENKTSVLSFKFYILSFIKENNYSNSMNLILEEWIKYKLERKEKYTEIGFNKLLAQLKNNIDKYGEQTIIELIEECMANNYKGIIFAKLKDKNPTEKVPEWFNQDIEPTVDSEKQKELEELLKEFN